MAEDNRDLLGDQMGYAVNTLLPPAPELRAIDRTIMRSLPRPIARAIALIRFNRGWLPDAGDPEGFYTEFTDQLGKLYLESYGDKKKANTLLMPGFGNMIKVHAKEFETGAKELPLRWDKQVDWANRTIEKTTTEGSVLSEEIKEATLIQEIQTNLASTFEMLKPQYVKRGLPFPEMPQVTRTNISKT
jgi:hypothetical protein